LLTELFTPGKLVRGAMVDYRLTADESVSNFNPHHGEGGRFASSDCPAPCHDGLKGGSRVGCPADQVPPPPPIGRLPNLTPQERRAENDFATAYERAPDKVAADYRAGVLATTKPGDPPTFETDGAKCLASVWMDKDLNTQCVNRATLNTALHGTANAIAKRAFLQHLDTLKPGDNVLVTCGGCGSGKGYSLKNVPEALAVKTASKAVWDSAGDQNASENRWVQRECEKRGLTATYVHVTADPVKSWADPDRGVVKRASDPRDGRMVDAKVFADSYVLGDRNMREFAAENRDNPSAKFVYLDARGHVPVKVETQPRIRLPSSGELADFAASVAVMSDAPPYIKYGATVGERVWPGDTRNYDPTQPRDSHGRWGQGDKVMHKGVAHTVTGRTTTNPKDGKPYVQVQHPITGQKKWVRPASLSLSVAAPVHVPVDKPPLRAPAAPAAPAQPAAPAAQPQSTVTETSWRTGEAQHGQVVNGVPLTPAPHEFWKRTPDVDVKEPVPIRPIDRVGVLIKEPDGRVWVVEPTGHFGNREHTLPGGRVEHGLTNQQNAMKEVWEETGLQVKITGHLGDFRDSNNGNNGRLYLGERVGGAPWDAKVETHILDPKTGKPAAESENVKLVTLDRAAQLLHRTDDLAQLATVRPVALGTKSNGQVMRKYVEGVKPAADAYAKTAGGDRTLHVVQEQRGFNGKPEVLSRSEMDQLEAAGTHVELLRGVKPTHTATSKELTDAFKTGDHFPGHGCFGSGTYADSSKGFGNRAEGYAGPRGDVIRMALPKTARVIEESELEAKVGSPPYGYDSGGAWSGREAWLGVHAALAGYDAIRVDGHSKVHGVYGKDFYVVLNRSILKVQRESAKGYKI